MKKNNNNAETNSISISDKEGGSIDKKQNDHEWRVFISM
jgi:hypothetical protein